jgi:amino acid transporter
MGWDNASTIAGEVHRPQRTYPLAMLLAVTLVAVTYLIPVAAIWHAGVDPHGLTAGGWTSVGEALGGVWLSRAIVLGAVLAAVGSFNALLLSYSHVPVALAQDRLLPSVLALRRADNGAPWVSIIVCCCAYAACLRLGFSRLVELDVLVYGLSLVLEFVALVYLRVREPSLPRPFKIPGGTLAVVLLGVPPTVLIVAGLVIGREEHAGGLPAFLLGSMLVIAGPIVYFMGLLVRRKQWLGQ